MTKNDLNEVLRKHQQWLHDDGGERADLRHAYLWGANLRGNLDEWKADFKAIEAENTQLRDERRERIIRAALRTTQQEGYEDD